jgi:hypothetical protein
MDEDAVHGRRDTRTAVSTLPTNVVNKPLTMLKRTGGLAHGRHIRFLQS